MWRYNNKTQVYKSLSDNIMVYNKIPNGIENHIRCSAYSVSENVTRHKMLDGFNAIEPINERY